MYKFNTCSRGKTTPFHQSLKLTLDSYIYHQLHFINHIPEVFGIEFIVFLHTDKNSDLLDLWHN